jgi:hypothetical protein
MRGLPLEQNAWRRSFFCFLMDGETANWRLNEAEMKACKVSVDISDK